MGRIIKNILILVVAWILPSQAATFAGENFLEERIGSLLPANAEWELSVVDMETGKEILNIPSFPQRGRTEEGLAPGSLVKLFTAGAMLDYAEKHGPIDMGVKVSHDGIISGDALEGSLYVVGGGNALLSVADIGDVVKGLSLKGIKNITGDIIADDTLFDTRGLERKRKGPGYAPAGALGLDLHTVSVSVTATEPGKAPFAGIEPPNNGVRFSVSARTVNAQLNTIKIIQFDDASYGIAGNIPAGSTGVRARFALKDPALYAAGVLKAYLDKAGIMVKGGIRRGETPSGANTLAEIKRPALDAVIRDMNVNSLNVVADNLLLLLGEKRFGPPGTLGKGLRAVEEFLDDNGRTYDGIKIADGSGLLDGNRVAARFMARYLQAISRRPWFSIFKGSLPSKREGTSAGMGFPDGSFWIKTGGLEDVRAIAGYGMTRGGKEFVFSLIANARGVGIVRFNDIGRELIEHLHVGQFHLLQR